MTDVYIVTLTVIGILLSSPGLAVALTFLFPHLTDRAYQRIDQTPSAAFFLGFIFSGILVTIILIFANLPMGFTNALAGIIGIAGLGVYAIGASAMSRVIGDRIAEYTGHSRSTKELIKGAVILELACFTPLVGWFLFLPLVMSINTGATLFALVGWVPRPKRVPVPQVDDSTAVATPTQEWS